SALQKQKGRSFERPRKPLIWKLLLSKPSRGHHISYRRRVSGDSTAFGCATRADDNTCVLEIGVHKRLCTIILEFKKLATTIFHPTSAWRVSRQLSECTPPATGSTRATQDLRILS